jgi:GT2 family glycosyltransferase
MVSTLLSVTVIIPVHKITRAFQLCVDSVMKALKPNDEIIVVADGVNMDTFTFLLNKPKIKILTNTKHSGPATARNLGSKSAEGNILFFIDSDVTVQPDTIQKVTSVFHTQKEVAAIIGSYDDEPADSNFVSQYKNLLHHYIHQTSNENASTFWGACGAVRKDVFLSLGGYNEDYIKPSIEDIELGYRLVNAGYKIRLCKEIQIKHYKKWTFTLLVKTDFLNRALPWTRLMVHHNRFLNDLNMKNSSRFSVFLLFLSLIFQITSLWIKDFSLLAAVALCLLLTINYPVYSFFKKKRGMFFALRVIPLHLFYFFYSGVAFGVVVVINIFERAFFISPQRTRLVTNYLKKPVK